MALGGYSGEAKNVMTNAIAKNENPEFYAQYASIGEQVFEAALTKGTSTAKIEITGSKAKGYETGEIAVFSEINTKTVEGEEGVGLFVGRPYWIVGAATNEFEVAYMKGEAGITPTAELKMTSKVIVLKEITNKKERIKTAYGAASKTTGIAKDAERQIEATATVHVRWLMYFSAVTSGTFVACCQVTEKTLENGDKYAITSGELSENGFA